FDRQAHRVLQADHALQLLHLELLLHVAAPTSVVDLRSTRSIACLPRFCATSSRLFSMRSALIVARTTLCGFELPRHFVRMSWMPALSTTARTAPPAITPVPSLAGFKKTRPAPKCPSTWWGMVTPVSGTLKRFFRAWSFPLR